MSGGPEPAYPFGHGLSYTRIELTDVRAPAAVASGEPLAVEVTATNVGDRAGSEVVQVYRRDRTGLVLRPERELVGFAKVRLEPGDSTRVQVELTGRAFAYWDVDAADWRTPEGEHELLVGRSSVDVCGEVAVRVSGGVTAAGERTEPADADPVAATDAAFAARIGRPIPEPAPVRPFTRSSTFDEIATTRVGRAFRDLVMRVSVAQEIKAADPGTAAMIERNFAELPLRAAARFGGGALPWVAIDAVVALVNGRVGALPRTIVRGLRRG